MSNQTLSITDPLYQYILDVSLREPPVLQELRERTRTVTLSQMQIAPEQGQFMGLLVKLLSARNIIEIGTYTGYSALSMAMHLPEDGKLVACDVSEEWTDIAREFWDRAGVANRIELQLRPALDTLEQLLAQQRHASFDMAFIDADKPNYENYFEKCLLLLRPGGLMLIDNVLWSGDVADDSKQDEETNSIRKLNQKLTHDARVDISLVPIGDGLTLCRKV